MKRGTRFDIAKQILGESFISFEEIEKVFFPIPLEIEQTLLRIDMEEEDLKKYAQSYYFIPHIGGRSINEMRYQHPNLFSAYQYEEVTAYNRQEPFWMVLAKEFAPWSFGTRWNQRSHFNENDDFYLRDPSVHGLVYAIVVLKIARNIELITDMRQSANTCDQARVVMEKIEQGKARIQIQRFQYDTTDPLTGVIPGVCKRMNY